jgi:hypothetical protein
MLGVELVAEAAVHCVDPMERMVNKPPEKPT